MEKNRKKWMSRADLALMLGVAYTTIRTWEKRDDFPKPYEFSPTSYRFDAEEVNKWFEQVIERRGAVDE